jgi:hypothetical protein
MMSYCRPRSSIKKREKRYVCNLTPEMAKRFEMNTVELSEYESEDRGCFREEFSKTPTGFDRLDENDPFVVVKNNKDDADKNVIKHLETSGLFIGLIGMITVIAKHFSDAFLCDLETRIIIEMCRLGKTLTDKELMKINFQAGKYCSIIQSIAKEFNRLEKYRFVPGFDNRIRTTVSVEDENGDTIMMKVIVVRNDVGGVMKTVLLSAYPIYKIPKFIPNKVK